MGFWCALFPQLISAEEQLATGQQFPRRVQVVTSHTYLRAGPGDDFYPTARLIHGESLELWSVSESGYGAVRPLTGSFSWLRAADVDRKIEEDSEIGVVITDGAVSRIGSQINALRHVAQVRLEAGERVRVLNEVRIQEGRHQGLWLQVAPPAGEFRWARLEDLDLPIGLAPQASNIATNNKTSPEETSASIVKVREAVDAWREVGDSLSEVMTVAGQLPVEDPEVTEEPGQLRGILGTHRLLADWMPVGSGLFDMSPPEPAATTQDGPQMAPTDELSDIDLALSLAVTGPSQNWDLETL